MIVEVVGGYLANRSAHAHVCATCKLCVVTVFLYTFCSLAIMTDAAHLLSDVGGFAVAIFAAQYASKRSQQSHTFG